MKLLLMILVNIFTCIGYSLGTASQECAASVTEIQNSRKISEFIDSLGGVYNLQGVWMFHGIFGVGKTKIEFDAKIDSLTASVNDSLFNQIEICESVKSSDVFELHVLAEGLTAAQRTIYLKKGGKNQIKLAAEQSKWNYISFYKADDANIAVAAK